MCFVVICQLLTKKLNFENLSWLFPNRDRYIKLVID